MRVLAQVLVGLVAVIHVYILILEMFLWQTTRGRTAFGTTAEFAAASAVLPAALALIAVLLAHKV